MPRVLVLTALCMLQLQCCSGNINMSDITVSYSDETPGVDSAYFVGPSKVSSEADAKKECRAQLLKDAPYESYPGSMFVCRHHENYLTAYSPGLRLPDWSAYYITPEEMDEKQGGRRSFKVDPAIPKDKQAPIRGECWSQEWNRGHLAPSNIMSYDKSRDGPWSDTYYITNTAMQWGRFNQGPWNHMEQHTISWIKNNRKAIYIITGTRFEDRENPTLCDENSGEIYESGHRGLNSEAFEVGVPDYYYKIMCDPSAKKSIAFTGHNRKDDFMTEVSVKTIEKALGFQLLPEETCNTGEFDSAYWWTEEVDIATKKGFVHASAEKQDEEVEKQQPMLHI